MKAEEIESEILEYVNGNSSLSTVCYILQCEFEQKQTEIDELVEFIQNHKSQLFMSYQNEAELLIQKHTKK